MKGNDFWDIDKLIPHRYIPKYPKNHVSQNRRTPSGTCDTAEIKLGNPDDSSVRLCDIAGGTSEPLYKAEFDYSDKSNIVGIVTVEDCRNGYSYSSDFSKMAHKIHYALPQKEAEFVPFFSYMPQYSDMSGAQYDYYLTWREHARNKEFIKADCSYIFLYVYELLALDDITDVKETLETIISLWSSYHTEHPGLDRYLGDWIVDYAVIHNIAIPFEKLESFIVSVKEKRQSVLFNMYLFDYVFADTENLTDSNITLACEILSNHKPFKSKNCASEDCKSIFDSSIKAIFKKLLSIEDLSVHQNYIKKGELKISRPSYIGAVCSASTKKNITLIYYPCTSNEIIRTSFTNVLKHTENKIRSSMGLKSRLSGIVLPDEARNIIDGHINEIYPVLKNNDPMRVQSAPKEIKKVSVNIAHAKEIEDISWQTTEKLTYGLETEDFYLPVQQPEPVENDASEETFITCFTDFEKQILKLILKNTPAQEISTFALSSGAMADACIDSINEKALEHIGDTVIDTSNYTIIPDYIDYFSSFNDE